jgi:hypothetical protein
MSEEKHPVLVVDLHLAGWERRYGPYRRVLMTRDEFVREVRKVDQRLSLVDNLLGSGSGLTNRERKVLDKEKRILARWLRDMPCMMIFENPSWGSEGELRIAKVWSGAHRNKAHKKKLRWLARKRGQAEKSTC